MIITRRESMSYTLGLDIGIASVGACAIDQENAKLIEMSVRRFEEAKEAKEARTNRSARRTLRRKNWRKKQLLDAFNDFNIISKEEIDKYGKENYLNFNSDYLDLKKPDVYTVYHLRQKAINEQVTKREILLCLYNILQARGHFLLDTVDFSKNEISFNMFKDKFYELTSPYIEFNSDLSIFEEKVLKALFSSEKTNAKDLKKVIQDNRFASNEDDLYDVCNIVAGRKAKIGRFYNMPDEGSVSVESLKKSDELNEFQNGIVELYDICRIARILKDGNEYVCDIAVQEIDKFSQLKKSKSEEKEFDEFKKASKNKIRAYKNLNNNYPNGLYVKEVLAILNNQKRYYPEISTQFVEVCSSIVSARIPYYVGPLGENAKNKWADINGKIKYSFEYSKDNIDIENTIRDWKKNMISHCTYLPEETALPKGSLLGEVFSIVNELNNFNCIDINGDDYYLTREDKIKVFDELFLKKETILLDDVKNLLNLNDYYSTKRKTTKFNNRISLYRQISSLSDDYKIDSIVDIFKDRNKLEKIENLILDLNLFDDGKFKYEYFVKNGFDNETAKKLSNIKTNGFYSFSKKFIYETAMNMDGESMLDMLFDDNCSTYRNNQQVIISNAVDKEGNKIDFLADKYERILRENNNKLGIDLILDNGKPLIPISRPVIRALNETFKVYEEYVNIYGVPSRVVVETARGKDSLKDFTEQNGSPMKHYDKTSKLVDYLSQQIQEKDRNNAILANNVESWDELEAYYNAHKNEIELYIRQDGIDLLTGKKIDINHLEDYEIDHILPRGFGDDSQDDKMLISKIANGKKGNRLPIEFLESEEAINEGYLTVGKFKKIVDKLAELKMISDKKQERLLLRNQEEAEGFINQNLVDTRYIISQFVSILNAYNKVNNYDTHIVCLKSAYTDLYRKVLGFNKNRDLGDQHHAYDAACICIADKCLSEYYPHYDERNNVSSKRAKNAGFETYSSFVNMLENQDGYNNIDSYSKLKTFIYCAFRNAYHQDIYKLGVEAPLIQSIKSTTPLISWKVEKNYNGKLFDATLGKPKNEDDKSVLTILGVNNEKRSFESVYPVAVDFYKYNHKHYAVHIPLAIIDSNGNINKEKYIKLITEHYKAPELLDENGDINKKLFRFRGFKHDLIFDTETNICHQFNLGSIAIKKLEIKPMNIFSYNDIYILSDQIRIALTSRFNVKTKKNSSGIEFNELDKKELIDYLCDELNLLDNPSKHKIELYEQMNNIQNLIEFCNKVSYNSFLANDIFIGPKYKSQILPTANNTIIAKNEDAEYVKIKYNTLGIRLNNNEKGKLIVQGPNGYKNGGFKLIKREKFHWTISKNML